MTKNNFNADKSISLETDDRFQRYPFARRIAYTIIGNKSDDGIVIGIYGAWGEGKTSVINFISNELNKDENIVQIKFNPWRFSDEKTLLTNFFNLLASELDTKLTNGKEKAGELVRKYGKLLKFDIPFLGVNVGETAEAVGDLLAEVDVEELRKRLEQIILESNKKLVIFIDDIDRLDKNEIHSIFRLVKLTADFARTTYILSFDEKVVSAAIGDRFGAGDIDSGRNFLEKIIQVPLGLPKAHSNALRDFTFEVINSVFENNGKFAMEDDESRRFMSLFIRCLLTKFDTPRMVARYGNALSFSLPLLYGEINTVDLMLIEAIKIAYPNIYYFIKSNPEYFIKENQFSIRALQAQGNDTQSEIVKKEFEDICMSYSSKEVENIKSLLIALFPSFVTHFKEYRPDWRKEDLYKSKRIASPQYFDRYFSYAVIKGELSDVLFDEFISKIPTLPIPDLTAEIRKLIEDSTVDNFLYKLRYNEEQIVGDDARKMAFAVLELIDLFPDDKESLFADSPRGQIVKFIAIQIRQQDGDNKVNMALELFDKIKSFDFIFSILYWIQPHESKPENRLDKEQFKKLWSKLLECILTEAGDKNIFEKYTQEECKIICIYWSAYDLDAFDKYIRNILGKQKEKIIPILFSHLPLWHTMGENKSRYGNLDEDKYLYITSKIDKELINDCILSLYPDLSTSGLITQWRDMNEEEMTDQELAKQFRHWYVKEQENKAEEGRKPEE